MSSKQVESSSIRVLPTGPAAPAVRNGRPFPVVFMPFSCVLLRRKTVFSGGESSAKLGKCRKTGTFLKFFLIHNEGETTFFQKNAKKGLAFFANVRYNIIGF